MEDVQETLHNIKRNSAEEYKIIRSESGIYNSEDRLYYRIYIPAPLVKMDEGQFIIDGLNSSLNRIYKEIGVLQGLSFYESNLSEGIGYYRHDALSENQFIIPLSAYMEGDATKTCDIQVQAKIHFRFFTPSSNDVIRNANYIFEYLLVTVS